MKPSPAAPAMASGFAPAHRGMGGPPRGGWENGRNNPGHGAPNYPDPFCRRRPSRFRERAWSVHPVRAPAASATDQPDRATPVQLGEISPTLSTTPTPLCGILPVDTCGNSETFLNGRGMLINAVGYWCCCATPAPEGAAQHQGLCIMPSNHIPAEGRSPGSPE